MRGLLLGLASGPSCLAYCAPFVVPYLLGEGASTQQNVLLLARFLLGRLVGYLAFGLLTGLAGSILTPALPGREILFGLAYSTLGVLLLVFGFSRSPSACPAGARGLAQALARRWPWIMPLLLGLFTGLNSCPPFLLALASAADTGSLIGSLSFFAAFFVGTSVVFLPLPGVGSLRRFEALRTVGRLAAGIMGAVSFYQGLVLVYGGLRRP